MVNSRNMRHITINGKTGSMRSSALVVYSQNCHVAVVTCVLFVWNTVRPCFSKSAQSTRPKNHQSMRDASYQFTPRVVLLLLFPHNLSRKAIRNLDLLVVIHSTSCLLTPSTCCHKSHLVALQNCSIARNVEAMGKMQLPFYQIRLAPQTPTNSTKWDSDTWKS